MRGATRLSAAIAAAIALAACGQKVSPAARRASLEVVGPASIKVIPAPQQYPFCLVYTASEKGIIRQLTMSPKNESFECKPGEPVGGTPYLIPANEGKVRVYVIFSDRKLDATPIGASVHEMGKSPTFNAMDLRAPGLVVMETLEFSPSAS
jgi:hypothetical protein